MERFTLADAAVWTNGINKGDAEILTVSRDSRDIPDGCLFIAIAGENFDGHDYIQMAIENGAAAVMSHRKNETYSVPTLYVEDTRQAMLDLASGYRSQFDCPIVAITGSVGKTTTRGMTQLVLSQMFETHATKGNYNNQLGMPLTLLELGYNHEAAVLEMGMSAFGEIGSMVDSAKPNISIITNVGTAHIEFLGSREGICRAKMEILDGLSARGGIAVLPADEPLIWDKRDDIICRKVWFGINNPESDIKATDIKSTADGVQFTIHFPDGKAEVKLSVPGEHNVSNALAAAAAGWLLGVSPEDIACGLAQFSPDGRRQKLYEKNGFTIYEDCYNASPDSMEAALKVLGSIKGGKKFAVLGSMLELGDYTEEGHKKTGLCAAKYADSIYLYGEHAQYMAEGAKESGAQNVLIFETHEDIANALCKNASKGDVLLFKGSRGMKMEKALSLFLGEEV